MDTTLVSVTLLSMGMAAALSVIVWRMLRDERHRSEARVTALTAMTARTSAAPVIDLPMRSAPPLVDLPMRSDPPMRSAAPAPIGAMPGTMFEERRQESPWGNRFAVMSALALVLASVILFSLAAGGSRSTVRASALSSPQATQPGAPAAVGLELVSLRDARKADALTITGLVRNPIQGSALQRVTVTAYAFDEKGSFLASGRALLDVTALAPGDESPFVVSVPVTETVARYRIGFRSEDGRVISHVDKRQQGPIAANW